MKRAHATPGENLKPENDFASAAAGALRLDVPLEAVCFEDEMVENQDFSGLSLRQMTFRRCRFTNCKFRRTSFADVVMRGCDLSGCDFSDSRLQRTEWLASKAVGTILAACYLQDFWLQDSKAAFLNLAESRLFFCNFIESNLQSADFTDCELKSIQLDSCDFTGASFYRTPLKGIDLRSCNIAGLGVEVQSPGLKGAVMDFTQLAELADILGIELK